MSTTDDVQSGPPQGTGRTPARTASLPVLAAMAVSVLAALAAFGPALDNDFVFDDLPVVVRNPLVTEPGPWYRFWRAPWWPPGESSDKLYRPLATCTLRWDARRQEEPGLRAGPFRQTNLALHALAAAAVALAAARWTGNPRTAWIAGPVFACHPVQTEAVVTIVGRAELLCGCLGAWLLARRLSPSAGRGTAAIPRGALDALLYAGAAMSKEHGLLLWPAVLTGDLLRWARLPRERRPAFRAWLNAELAPGHLGFLLAATLFFLLRYGVFGWVYTLDATALNPWQAPMTVASPAERWLTPFQLTWLAATLLIWPAGLCPLWSVPALMPAGHINGDVLAGMALWLAAVAGLLSALRRSWTAAMLLVGLMLALAVPVHMLPLAHWLFAERWLYLPMVFAAVLIGGAADRLGPVGVPLGLAAGLACLPATWQYGTCFRDSVTMYRQTVLRQPDNYQGRRNLAILLWRNGEYTAAIEEAAEMIDRFDRPAGGADRFGRPHLPYLILARCFLSLGDGQRALEALDEYEAIRGERSEPGLEILRQQAEALTRPAPASESPDLPPSG